MFGLVQLSMIRFSLGLSSITGVVGRFYYVPGRTAAVCEIKVVVVYCTHHRKYATLLGCSAVNQEIFKLNQTKIIP